jgi:oxygen-independent coproporphyrinogen-3 oxidase
MDWGLYVHVPFCVKRCRYCAFPSGRYDESLAARYLSAVGEEMRGVRRKMRRGERLITVYVGGGTPTCLGRDATVGLLNDVHAIFPVTENAETTVEANPGTCDAGFAHALRGVGVNRLSVGAQSFNPDVLGWLERIHSSDETAELARAVHDAGLQLSVDLIYGVPGQSHESWEDSLHRAVALDPDHFSIYALSVDIGSRYAAEVASGQQPRPDDDIAASMYSRAVSVLSAGGYQRYEVSNFAKPGKECRHNQRYWSGCAYLGVGPGAHSYDGDTKRWSNEPDTAKYVLMVESRRTPCVLEEDLDLEMLREETMMLGLRTTEGIELTDYEETFGEDLLADPNLTRLVESGVLIVEGGRLRLSEKFFFLADGVALELLGITE